MAQLLVNFERKISSVSIFKMIARTANRSGECWVDDHGHLHFADEHVNNPIFKQPIRPTYRGEGFAFRHLGMAHLRFEASQIIIRWDVNHVASEAIDGILNYLDECQQDQTIVLKFYYVGWNTDNGNH